MILVALLFSLILTTIAQECHTSVIVGAISVNDGTSDSTYIAQTGGTIVGGIAITGDSLNVQHDRRIYLASECSNSFDPKTFKQLKLLDRTLSYTVDLSNVGCACNAALYLVAMPAYNQNNQPDPTKCGDYYCDANNVCGIFCVEMDIMEANNRAYQTTPHKCDSPQGNYYPHCDQGGCGINTKYNPNDYGFGSQYTINTQQPFQVSVSFKTQGGTFNKMETVLSQNSKQLTYTHDDGRCGCGYLESMTNAFQKGMVLVISYWGDTAQTMSWLDIPPCGNNDNCNINTAVTFRNITIS